MSVLVFPSDSDMATKTCGNRWSFILATALGSHRVQHITMLNEMNAEQQMEMIPFSSHSQRRKRLSFMFQKGKGMVKKKQNKILS